MYAVSLLRAYLNVYLSPALFRQLLIIEMKVLHFNTIINFRLCSCMRVPLITLNEMVMFTALVGKCFLSAFD